ncbi:hypothetical protein MW290_06060 [Aquincola tertiaricarbonis]|uniref:Lipoprotein n=1 Tax=Aquincola tertiaricarbonis TaxID=391953 RepID=A0ABY4S846_AQUTE|nr:hypothetical protein [Aquincola tertiaricarbonis]URI08141.1 hypothetical protein MW290_06060 [Aquincola tertiaricarbonis]
MPAFRSAVAAAGLLMLLAGCATRSVDVKPLPSDPAAFSHWPCEALYTEADKVQRSAADVAYTVDERVGNNIIALGVGATVFWPAMLAMRPDGPDAAELARLRGRYDALQSALGQRGCPPQPDTLSVEQLAGMPLKVGERLVYEERRGRTAARELGLRLQSLRRDQLEFRADLPGADKPVRWQQDGAGNIQPPSAGDTVVYWTRLLRPELGLGDVLAGELRNTNGEQGRVRGQVVATGVQTGFGRAFDAAVIELYGDVPFRRHTTRIDGVMVVDRKSGVLLRLELRSSNADFALRRTLLRVEPAA